MYSPSFFSWVVLEPSSSFSTVRAPLSLERAAAGSVVESPGGSGSTTRRVDPRAAFVEATERNAREVREEQEAREAEARRAAAAQAARKEEAAKALAEAAAKAQAEAEAEAAAGEALMVTPCAPWRPGTWIPRQGEPAVPSRGWEEAATTSSSWGRRRGRLLRLGRPKAASLSLRPHSRRGASRPRGLRWRSEFRQAGVRGRPRLNRRRLRRSHSRPWAPARRPETRRRPALHRGGRRAEGQP